MAKLSLVDFEDNLMVAPIIGPILDKFYEVAKKLPDAIIVTPEQWSKFFSDMSGPFKDFRGIPLESPQHVTDKQLALTTIDNIMSKMHRDSVTRVDEVYNMLESVKEKLQ